MIHKYILQKNNRIYLEGFHLTWCTAIPQTDRKYIKDKAVGNVILSQSKCVELQIKLEVSN